jgi:membrane dipeptidase
MTLKGYADSHVCTPLLESTDLEILKAHKEAGFRYISLNIGMDMYPYENVLKIANAFQKKIDCSDNLVMANTLTAIDNANKLRKLAVSFDIEGASIFGLKKPNFNRIDELFNIGLRQVSLSYNRNNNYCGGCQDKEKGLTDQGAILIDYLQNKGIVIDCSHASYESSRQIINYAQSPVIFSHSNSYFINKNPRNLPDELIIECAQKGGMVCINGLVDFLGPGERIIKFVEHINHLVDIIGIDHIGIGLDYGYDQHVNDLPSNIDQDYWWPKTESYTDPFNHSSIPPSETPSIITALSDAGYCEGNIKKITGENYLNFLTASWK